ncbi:WD40/YVTN/BNR-like repeat-containing protein [Zavarzinella formosa]|uniref:WD40/YVTN/BNR-like repeat-containing protein n=1 Tax=Zavarzinella formosa TaxID=360055 RepID=UPI0002EEDA5F|nr:hypothetical protein [Zavarzinella formosa]
MNLFIAVGHDGLRMASADGVAWTDKQTGKEGETYRAVSFGNGHAVAVGSYGGGNIFASTADGKTWKTQFIDAKYVKYARGLGFGKEQFVALGGDPGSVGSSRPFVLFTKTGETWTEPLDIPGKHILRRLAFGNNLYVAVGDRGRRAASTDGKEWKEAPETKAIDTLVDVAYGNGVFVGVGLHGLRMTTKDGITWTDRQIGDEGEHMNSIVWAKDRFVAVGAGATYFSADGKMWERKPNKNAPQFATHGNGLFVGVAWKGRLFTSKDAITWTETFKSDKHIEGLTFAAFEK